MKLRQLTLALSLVGASSVGLVGCGGDSHSYEEDIESFEVFVFDGYARNCRFSFPSFELNPRYEERDGFFGRYTIFVGFDRVDTTIEVNACVDADTGVDLPTLMTSPPTLTGASTPVISPVTTLIELSRQGGQSLASASSTITTNLGLDGYEPFDRSGADFVRNVNSNATSASRMQTVLSLTTMMKGLEKAADDGGNVSTREALSSLAGKIANAGAPIDLTDAGEVDDLISDVADDFSGDAQTDLLDAQEVSDAVAAIAGATNVEEAAGIAKQTGDAIDDDDNSLQDVGDLDPDDAEPIDVGNQDQDDADDDSTGATGGSNV